MNDEECSDSDEISSEIEEMQFNISKINDLIPETVSDEIKNKRHPKYNNYIIMEKME